MAIDHDPYRRSDPRKGLRQALLVQIVEEGHGERAIVEWIPEKFKAGDTVKVAGIPGDFTVRTVYA